MNKNQIIEKLLQVFSEIDRPLKLNELSKIFAYKSDTPEYELMKESIRELELQGVIEKLKGRKFRLIEFEDASSAEGFLNIKNERAFIETGEKPPRIIAIKRRHIGTALFGDYVKVRLITSKKNKKPRGEVVKVIKRVEREITGTIDKDGIFHFLIPDDDRFFNDFLVHQSKLNGAAHGDKVTCRFLSWTDKTKSPRAEVIKINTKSGQAGPGSIADEYDAVFEEFFIPKQFPPEVLKAAADMPKTVRPAAYEGRMDLRKHEIITIDPDDAKDFDDALSLEILDNGNYYLGVHIADVSHYVEESGVIDEDAGWRGTSIYLVDRVVPMLPESLSNEMCSLKPNRIRLAYTVFMEITPKGDIANYHIQESVIKSKKRFTYKEVQEIIESGKGKLKDLVLPLHKLALLLRAKRFKTGGIDFVSDEYKFILDKDKMPVEVEQKISNSATQLVEECMLIANKVVANHLYDKSKEDPKIRKHLPFLFRVHDEPNPEKLSTVVEFLRIFGAKAKLENSASKSINNFIAYFDKRPEKAMVHQMLLRTMSKAEYSEKNIGHYGLGFKNYTHFTSPIRRYPDLIVHRLTKEYSKTKVDIKRIKKLEYALGEIAAHSTARERVAIEAERASVKLAQSIYAKKFLGDKMQGTISGVTSFGIFVLLNDICVEGLVHMKDMKDDYYVFDERKYRLVGRRKKKIFTIGQTVNVQLVDVNIKRRRVDLVLVKDE